MKFPFKRKKTKRQCPINIESLYRHWDRGDNRIDWNRIEKLHDAWLRGEKVPWRKLSHTFIKKLKRHDRNPAREDFFYHPPIRGRLNPARIQADEERHNEFWHQMNNWFEMPILDATVNNNDGLDYFYGPIHAG